MTVVTNDHKSGGLKQEIFFYSFTFLEARVPEQFCWVEMKAFTGLTLLQRLCAGEESVLCLSHLLVAAGIPWFVAT